MIVILNILIKCFHFVTFMIKFKPNEVIMILYSYIYWKIVRYDIEK